MTYRARCEGRKARTRKAPRVIEYAAGSLRVTINGVEFGGFTSVRWERKPEPSRPSRLMRTATYQASMTMPLSEARHWNFMRFMGATPPKHGVG